MSSYEPNRLPVPIDRSTRRMRWRAIVLLTLIGAIPAVTVALRAEARAGDSTFAPSIRSETSPEDTVYWERTLSMAAGSWIYGSVPSMGVAFDGHVYQPTSLLEVPGIHNAELHWYSPSSVVKERDLNPGLTDAQGARNSRPVLALSIPRRPAPALPTDSLWVSITHVLDPQGEDLVRTLFIEVWINDWRDPSIRGPGARLHLDLGTVSEDQMRAPNQPPNLFLDTEDHIPRDGVLASAEDTGMDAAGDATRDGLSGPLDVSTASEQDPAGDDYASPSDQYEEIDPRRWVRTNGTEGNRLARPYPDTEDLNYDGSLDRQESYFEYTIDMSDADTRYLVTDVHSDYPNVPDDNGWRLYRIPIDDAERLQFGNIPNLAVCRYARVWIDRIVAPDGPEDPTRHVKRPLLMLGGIRIFGWGHGGTPKPPDTRPAVISALWPNPVHESVTIDLVVPRPQAVDLIIHDLGGRRVRRLKQGSLEAGHHDFIWDLRDDAGARLPPGLYLIELRSPDHSSSAKVLVID